jgi:hypothetical protein
MRSRILRSLFAGGLAAGLTAAALASDATSLYGVHWWRWTPGQPVDTAPAAMLDLPGNTAWCLETVLTHSAPWWAASYFAPLYTILPQQGVSMITRVDFTWDETIPPPGNPHAATWPATVASQIVDALRHGCRLWVIGNEPNIVAAPGSLWPDRQIPPAAYAATYRAARHAIRTQALPSPHGPHLALLAGPSPGGPIPGVRWMDGLEYLDQVLSHIPAHEVDGFALHAYGGTGASFLADLQAQLAVIRQHGHSDKPVWVTEFNRYTANDADEAHSAQFVRDAYRLVHEWNQTPGAHNIVGMTWFVYDANQQAGGGWNGYAVEHWKHRGFPAGDPRDLFTAFAQAVDQRYPAGRFGTKPIPAHLANPGFEDQLDGWRAFGQVDGSQTGPWFAGIEAYSGARFFGSAAHGGAKNGGLFQTVASTPGTTRTAAAWVRTYRQGMLATQCRIGLDPAGGTSPTAGTVRWSPWTSAEDGWRQVRVSAAATGPAITVFLEHRQSAGNVWNVTAFDHVQIADGTSALTGHVSLQGLANPLNRRVDLELRGAGGEVIAGVPLAAGGSFGVMTPLRGTFEVVARAPGWLSGSAGMHTVTNAGVSRLSFSLLGGDIVRDGVVDLQDFLRLAATYEVSPHDPAYDPAGDLDFDGRVDLADFLILAANYGRRGE